MNEQDFLMKLYVIYEKVQTKHSDNLFLVNFYQKNMNRIDEQCEQIRRNEMR